MVSGMVKTGIVGGVGIVVVVLSATLGWILVPNLATDEAILKSENTAVFDAWSVPPVPVIMQYFLFNCTNCDNPRNPNIVLKLDQLGPFTFSEGRIKYGSDDGHVVEKDGKLTYRENITYFYDPTPGETPLDAVLTTVNPVYFTLASLIADYAPSPDLAVSLSSILNTLLASKGERPFMTRTVREMLYEGWSLQPYVEIIEMLAEAAGITIPPGLIPEDPRFGFFYGRNGTNLGEFTIESGSIGLDQLGLIRDWNGNTKLSYWNDDLCDMINGTDGAIYPPLVDVDKPIYIFTPDLCRSIYATYERDYETEGIVGKRFTVPEVVFGAPADTPENLCYCRYKDDTSKCFAAGVLDMRACQFGAPVLLSTPHFYMGDEKYVKAFEGLEPVQEWHETHFDLEPLSGVPIFASKRIQINIDVQNYYMPSTAINLKDTVFPIVWINETAKLDAASAEDVDKLLNTVNALNISRWVFLAAGIALVIAGFVMLIIFFPR